MVAIKNFLLFAATAAALVIPRDVTTVLNSLKKLDTDTQALTKATTSWDGGLESGVAIQNLFTAVDNDLKSATKVASAEKVASSADTKTILAYVNATLSPDIKASLNALVAKKPAFVKAGLQGLVQSDLATLSKDADALGAALQKIASADQQAAAKTAIDAIKAAIAAAVKAFAT